MKAIKITVAVAFALGLIAVPVALQSRIKDTPHKLTGTHGITVTHDEVCRPCHTPHRASTEAEFLWNHKLTDMAWTIDADADKTSMQNSSTRLCMSCHDGTVAIDSYGGATGTVFLTGNTLVGTDLTTSHPVGVTYPIGTTQYNQPDASGNIRDATETPTGQSAHLEDGKVQCGSCHFAHGSRATYGMFLRVDNTGSKLCMTCHVGPG
jgi:predicted CXXCH cytochrome family protein